MVWASKPLAAGFSSFSHKTSGAFGAPGGVRSRHVAKLALRRIEVVKAPCPSDAPSGRWTKMPLGELSLVIVE